MGHLFPTGKYYEDNLIIAGSEYDDNVILKENIYIPASPRWYSSLNDFLLNIETMAPGKIVKIYISVTIEEDNEGVESMNIVELKRENIIY